MKTNTFKTFLLLLAVFSFFGCKKSSGDGYYVKLKINGSWITWETAIGELGPDFADPAKTDFGVTANNDSQDDVFDLTIQINGSNFTTGTYASDNLNYYIVIDYLKDASGNAKFYQISDAPGRPACKFTVNVTAITSTTLKGTFTGNYLYDDIDDESLELTEGEFFVRRAR